jgi:putative membrane protein
MPPFHVHGALLAAVLLVLVWSGIGPYDRYTWFLEVTPVLIALPLLGFTYFRFRLTTLLYALIAAHAVILLVGGHYTYARVPLFDWLRDALGLERNHYDRVGHFAQGFVPAMITREILLRTTPLKRGRMLFFLVVCVCLAISAVYELIEWIAAELAGDAAADFLGTQGDPWDTQKDMALAGVGAVTAQLALRRAHDRALVRLGIWR